MNIPHSDLRRFREFALDQLQHQTHAEEMLALAGFGKRPSAMFRLDDSTAVRRRQMRSALNRIRRGSAKHKSD